MGWPTRLRVRMVASPTKTTRLNQASSALTSISSALPVCELGALSHLDNVTVWIANVAARLAVLRDRLGNELSSPTLPQLVACMNIRNANVHKPIYLIRVRDAEGHCRLIRRRPAADVDKEPGIRDLDVCRRAVAVAWAENATAEHRFVETSRSVDVSDGEKIRHGKVLPRRHLVTLLFDLYT